MSHPSIEVMGRAREKVHPYRIGFSTAMSRQFAIERDRATRGAFIFEYPELGRAHARADRRGERSVGGRPAPARPRGVRPILGIRVYGEQLPERRNAVSLAPKPVTTSAAPCRTSIAA